MTFDRDRWRMMSLVSEAWIYLESDPNRAMDMLEQGRQIAEKLKDNCYLLRYDCWRAIAQMFYMNRPAKGLELAVHTAVEISKPANTYCDERTLIYSVLVEAFVYNDPAGYAEKIRETSNFIENDLSPSPDTWALLQWHRAYVSYARGDLDEALDAALRYLDRCSDSDFRLTDAYSCLCEFSYARGDFQAVYEFAQLGETHARLARSNIKRWLSEFIAWQAMCLRRQGNTDAARTKYLLAVSSVEHLNTVTFAPYYDAMCDYHETGGELDESLSLRDKQLDAAVESGSPYIETECRLRRVRLLKKMGKPHESELSAAREAAKHLLKPEIFLAKLDA